MTGTAAAVTERVVVALAGTDQAVPTAGAMRPRSAVFRRHCGVRHLQRLLQLRRLRAQAR